jgi:membrane protein
VIATAFRERISQLSAAVAFYTIFSLAPTLILAVAIAGYVFGPQAAREELVARVGDIVGPTGAQVIADVVVNVRRRFSLATTIGVATVLLGASVGFAQLQDALNQLWGVNVEKSKSKVVLHFLRKRALSFLMVLGTGMLLLASLVTSTTISIGRDMLDEYFDIPMYMIHAANFGVAVLLATVIFAVIYKVLPDARIDWSDVWVGATFTAILFALGSATIAHYLGTTTIGSAYGAAGSLFAFLVWIYYSAHVFFLGAAFTEAYSHRFGKGIRPHGRKTSRSRR